ncbi:7-cyano-7-deazaguanine synthase [Streptomyces sp. NBC_00258]|uniref:7-cyano-7-deazaguanine synthase n=1 Tax=Streptomyces sp. NBC_00258 TaxID=2903642 RepID=UPI002E2E89F1|nr:7-cyano-7-deazaguanine synthase [Streptomyces sp. NBC_00258]
MSSAEPYRFWWRSYDGEKPRTAGWHAIGAAGFREREERITGHQYLDAAAPDWADDLLRLARAAFLADKLASREKVLDRWTRRFSLSLPVSDPLRWTGTSAGLASALLQMLTGDHWDIRPRALRAASSQPPIPLGDDWRATEVALFSGGLDSLSWAAQRAGAPAGLLLLVTFAEPQLESLQHGVLQTVEKLARDSGRVIKHANLRQVPGGRDGRSVETSSRSRGLLYSATAVRAAAASNIPVVYVPENGQLALNPPLTAARSSALSTRSVHPWTLHLLNRLIRSISGAEGTVTVTNPLAHLTKGEVCKAAVHAGGLLPADLEATLSCGAPPRRRQNRPHDNCGVCYPCLVRRSGLLYANGADATDYEASPTSPRLPRKRTRDFHALRRWLETPYGPLDLIADQPLPPGTEAAPWLDVIDRGRTELRALVRAM